MARKQVWQRHHITYDPEWIVSVTRGEHFLITQLQRFGSLSHGAIQAIAFEIARKPLRPVEVVEEKKKVQSGQRNKRLVKGHSAP